MFRPKDHEFLKTCSTNWSNINQINVLGRSKKINALYTVVYGRLFIDIFEEADLNATIDMAKLQATTTLRFLFSLQLCTKSTCSIFCATNIGSNVYKEGT